MDGNQDLLKITTDDGNGKPRWLRTNGLSVQLALRGPVQVKWYTQ